MTESEEVICVAMKSEDNLGKKICSVKAVADEGCDPYLKDFLKCLMFSTSTTCSSEWATLKDCLMNQGLVKAGGHLGKSPPDSTKAMPKVSSQIDTAEVVFVARCVRDYEGEETCSIQTTGGGLCEDLVKDFTACVIHSRTGGSECCQKWHELDQCDEPKAWFGGVGKTGSKLVKGQDKEPKIPNVSNNAF